MFRQLSTSLLLLVATAMLATAPANAWTIKACLGSATCSTTSQNTFTHLQSALDYISATSTRRGQDAWVMIKPGLYQSSTTRTFQHSDWRANCVDRTAHAGFLLSGRTGTTTIYGTGQGSQAWPFQTRIWGKIPDWMITHHGHFPNIPRFHAMAVVDNPGEVIFQNLSLISDGGMSVNGAGDASLYVHDSVVTLDEALVLGNKGGANCLLQQPDPMFFTTTNWGSEGVHPDQEGVLVEGLGAFLRVERSAVGGNLHTGIMLLGGATAEIDHSVVKGNGWDGGHFQTHDLGHGVTSFAAGCLDNDTHMTIRDSVVVNNTGFGVLVRGEFEDHIQTITTTDLTGNGGDGTLCAGNDYQVGVRDSTFARIQHPTGITIRRNDFGSSADTIVLENVTLTGGARADISNVGADQCTVSGPVAQWNDPSTGAPNTSFFADQWSNLLTANNMMLALTDTGCPILPVPPAP